MDGYLEVLTTDPTHHHIAFQPLGSSLPLVLESSGALAHDGPWPVVHGPWRYTALHGALG
ncbi:hypothetical protein CC85DRAFT_287330 [Cutaneotrichosporon oleaginosum]|uniref:Uncharacterized protein n=1 Tax=Cutaneotrichosporon oleaginosum TaxID=879819 RepID=A0A0J0XHX2_9TREE|nr:uncharacterized protein CC85DRAFT_287330 [Cutaneotrichosporon oleaginosum]KLT40607.1 hypothetical protein CC85DRAFT_287330 [Cutaneotrichosporon oleaginosum]TXT03930.1 hypothetical protein COLE_07627 [Cutaneotrichosporon oleaginosum]